MPAEYADDILAGIYCQACGVVMDDMHEDDVEPPGYPRTCDACAGDEDTGGLGKIFHSQLLRPFNPKTEKCHTCGKKFAGTISLRQHMRYSRHG